MTSGVYNHKGQQGFQRGHKGFGTKTSFLKISKTMKRKYANGEIRNPFKGKKISHLKKYQFKKNGTPWNKGIKGYKIDRSWWNNEDVKKRHSENISKATRGKPRPDKRGNKSHFWKGGISKLREQIHQSYKYREWRREVFERDKYTCQDCKQKGNDLVAHHDKKSFAQILSENNVLTFKQAMDCKELWDVSNGKTLCDKCHKKTKNYGGLSNQKINVLKDGKV